MRLLELKFTFDIQNIHIAHRLYTLSTYKWTNTAMIKGNNNKTRDSPSSPYLDKQTILWIHSIVYARTLARSHHLTLCVINENSFKSMWIYVKKRPTNEGKKDSIRVVGVVGAATHKKNRIVEPEWRVKQKIKTTTTTTAKMSCTITLNSYIEINRNKNGNSKKNSNNNTNRMMSRNLNDCSDSSGRRTNDI